MVVGSVDGLSCGVMVGITVGSIEGD